MRFGKAWFFLLVLSLAFGQPAAAYVGAKPKTEHWVPTWYASPVPNGNQAVVLADQTIRQIVKISAGGDKVRIRLSNAYGTAPLHIDAVTIAQRDVGSRIKVASSNDVTFGGHKDVTIAPGAYVVSDAIALNTLPDSDLAISLYVSKPTTLSTVHEIQRGAIYSVRGNQVHAEAFESATGIGAGSPWLAEVMVSTSPTTHTIIALGDSITDGYGITPDIGGTWPEVLSQRLHKAGLKYSVINAGISGNRLLHHGQWVGFGENVLSRFDRDVLSQPNVSDVVVLIGINDLGHANGPGSDGYVSADDIIGGLTQLALRAHEHGIHIHICTLLPFKETVFAGYYSDEKNTQRRLVNDWIRKNTVFDSVIDLDKVTEDPARPGYLRPDIDVGDHLHPNTAGANLMGTSIPLRIFSKTKK